jgi:hypothetical protein
MAWFGPDDVEGRIEHALRVERILVNLGWFVAGVGVVAVVSTVGAAVLGETSWSRALVAAFGILAATVLSQGHCLRIRDQHRPRGHAVETRPDEVVTGSRVRRGLVPALEVVVLVSESTRCFAN